MQTELSQTVLDPSREIIDYGEERSRKAVCDGFSEPSVVTVSLVCIVVIVLYVDNTLN
jgi:hypothetical protein